MKNRILAALTCCVFAACNQSAAPVAQHQLAALSAASDVTVSGLSSGGYMAGQFQLAFSASVTGAAVIAAGPWGCSQGEITRALAECISGEGIDVGALQEQAATLAAEGDIDSLENLASQRLFFFLGASDPIIQPAVVEAAQQLLLKYAEPPQITMVNDIGATHGWVTSGYGAECATFGAPYINQCDYDLAGAILQHLYSDLKPPKTAAENLVKFEQAEFGDASLAEFGFAYVPNSCHEESCQVHIFFHGCEQSAATIDTTLIEHAGFNEWAETNNLIILYPQVAPSSIAPMNPLGCWDWWGYTGADYLSKDAPQLAAVQAMVQRLQQPD